MEKNKPVGDKANKRHIAFDEEYLANGMNGKNNTEWFTLTDEIKNYIEYGN